MKKLVSLLVALMMVLALVSACAGNTTTGDSEATEAPAATEAAGTETTETAAPEATEATDDEAAKMGGTLIVRASGDPMSWCPSAAADDNGYPIYQNMFNRLTKLDSSKSPIPDAAESWDVSDDALTITFHLKQNMHWWDGEALDANDVKYTFDYIKANSTCYFSSAMSIVDSIDVVDDYTVVFNMNTADMSFIARLGWYGTFIVPEHIYNNGQDWTENEAATTTPVGSGPFMFDSYKQGESVTIVRNENYHDSVPYLDKIVFSIVPDDATSMEATLNGEIDYNEMVLDSYLAQFQADPENFRLDLNEYPSPWRMIFNMNNEVVGDLAVRQAIALCIDREDISNKVTGGIMPPEYSAYPSLVTWCSNVDDVYPSCDIEAARKVLEDAGYVADADGFYVRGITLDAFEGQLVDMSKLIIANCAEAGIEITLQVSEYNAWAEKVNPDATGTAWMIETQGGFMGPDPAALASRYGTGSGSNYASYSNAAFDELCAKGAAEGDTEKRAEYYREAQKLLIEDLPAINILAYANYEVANAHVKDLPIDGVGKWGWQEYTYTYFDNLNN